MHAVSSSAQWTHVRSLEIQLLRGWHASSSEGLSVCSSVDLQVSPHRRSAFVGSVWRASEAIVGVVFDCAAEPSSERRDVIPVLALIVLWCFVVSCSAARSAIATRVLEISVAAVGVEHVQSWSSLLRRKDVVDLRQHLLEVKSVLFFNFQHADQHACHFLSQFLLYPLKVLKQRVEADLEVLVVVDVSQALPEDDFDEHESKHEHVSLGSVVLGVGSVLRKGDHLLRREVDSFDIALFVNLLIGPACFSFAHNAPSIPVRDPFLPNADHLAVQRHLADSLDDLQQFLQRRGADVLEQNEVRDEKIVGENEVMNGHWMWCFAVLAFSDVELHALVADTL